MCPSRLYSKFRFVSQNSPCTRRIRQKRKREFKRHQLWSGCAEYWMTRISRGEWIVRGSGCVKRGWSSCYTTVYRMYERTSDCKNYKVRAIPKQRPCSWYYVPGVLSASNMCAVYGRIELKESNANPLVCQIACTLRSRGIGGSTERKGFLWDWQTTS